MIGVQIRRLHAEAEIAQCAHMMAASDPWKRLGRDYASSYLALADPLKELYGAWLDGSLLGFILINMTGAFVGYIQSVCVAPTSRGQRIGTALLEYAEARIFAATPNVFICVSSFNPRARMLYERQGYEVVGVLTNYIVAGHDEVLLRKTVAPLTGYVPRNIAED